MAVTETPRFRLPQWSAGTDLYPGRTGFNTILSLLETQAAMAAPSGALANRPRGGTFGRFYLATDQGDGGRLFYDGGSGWIEINTNGGGGPGQPVVINGTATEGVSNRSARADHTHNIPLANTTRHGALASQHYALLAAATSNSSPGTLARRGPGGNIEVGLTPTGANEAVSRNWVENVVGDYNIVANGLVRRYSNGHFRAPNAPGPDDVTNRRYVDGKGDQYPTPFSFIQRWDNGVGGRVWDPIDQLDVANKRYADSRASRTVWKDNIRPVDYGLAEVERIVAHLFDYAKDAPESVAGTTDVRGGLVEQVAEVAPGLVEDGEDGAPERIKDRELVWVLLRAVQELSEQKRELNDRIHRIEGYLGL